MNEKTIKSMIVKRALLSNTDENAQVNPTNINPIEETIPPSKIIATNVARTIDNRKIKLDLSRFFFLAKNGI